MGLRVGASELKLIHCGPPIDAVSRVQKVLKGQDPLHILGSGEQALLHLLHELGQELVHAVPQSCKMQEIRLIENQSDESGAFVRQQ